MEQRCLVFLFVVRRKKIEDRRQKKEDRRKKTEDRR
jgi:hypothetical protein